MGRWILGAIILLFVGLVYGLVTADSRMMDMQSNIKSDFAAAGHTWADVEVFGNEARVSGTAPNAREQAAVIQLAEAAYCSACKEKHRWHTVKDLTDIVEAVALPVQSPYTFSATKAADGMVVLNGYVPSDAVRDDVLRNAVEVFGNDKVSNNTLVVADGAPNGMWANIIKTYLPKLAQLDEGRLLMEDLEGSLQGKSSSVDVQRVLYAQMGEGGSSNYNFVGNIAVPEAPAEVFGQSGSQAICQGLMDELRRGRKIGFRAGDAAILGDDNLDLLANLSSAAKQCPAFRIAINGYTSSDGAEAFNQNLSENRANAVLFHLNQQGNIDLSRLTARGFGEANPIASNETLEGRMQNRRIEFILSRAE